MLSTVLYYELAMKVPIPVGITVYLLTWGLGHLRCLVLKDIDKIRKKPKAFSSILYSTGSINKTSPTRVIALIYVSCSFFGVILYGYLPLSSCATGGLIGKTQFII